MDRMDRITWDTTGRIGYGNGMEWGSGFDITGFGNTGLGLGAGWIPRAGYGNELDWLIPLDWDWDWDLGSGERDGNVCSHF